MMALLELAYCPSWIQRAAYSINLKLRLPAALDLILITIYLPLKQSLCVPRLPTPFIPVD
jgi:hypothetical protein